MPSLATLSAGFVVNDIPFQYYVGTDAHNEDRLIVGELEVYQVDFGEFYVVEKGEITGRYFDEVEEVIKFLKGENE